MSPDDPARSPDALAARFLGSSAGAGGPFALLGVGHGTRDPGAIRAAGARRLARIDRHPLRLTPEADELRLAVHAAMAQLTDPALHAALARHWPAGETEPSPAAWRSHLSAVTDQMSRQARLIVGASGGWNARAKKRLAHLARLHRVNANDLIRALRPGPSVAARSADGRRPETAPATAFPEVAGPGSSGRLWLLIHASLAVLLVGMASAVVVEWFRPAPAPVPVSVPAPVAAERGESGGAGDPVPGARANIEHHAALEQELGNILRVVGTDPGGAAERAGRAMRTFFERWPDMPSESRDRIVVLVARIIAALPDAGLPRVETAAASGIGSGDITAHAGAAAFAARLAAEASIPRSVREWYGAMAAGIDPGAAFDEAVVSALHAALTGRPPETPAQWMAWSAALDACTGASVSGRTRARLNALEMLLRDARPPGPEWRGIAATLASGLSWRSGDPARAWLLEQLADESVPGPRLAGLTAALATEVSVPGVDARMVLEPDAGAARRAELAAAYRAAWATVGDEAARARLHAALAGVMERADRSMPNAPDRVGLLVGLARANAAAAAFESGREALAAELLAMPEFDPMSSASPTTRTIGGLTDEWGLTLINTQSPELASSMLIRAMQDRTPFSPLAADAVVAAALSGGTRPLRDQARAVVVASAWDVQVLLAVERAAARRPGAVVGEIVTNITGVALPAPRDEGWLERVRSALLPRIAELVAAAGSNELIWAEAELAEVAARRAGLDAGTAHMRSLLTEIDRLSRANGLPASDPLSADSIRSRQAARASSAGARAQMIAVQHRALVEFLAADTVVRGGGGGGRAAVERRLGVLAREWAAARTVIDQLLAGHRAEAELWRSRLEGAL